MSSRTKRRSIPNIDPKLVARIVAVTDSIDIGDTKRFFYHAINHLEELILSEGFRPIAVPRRGREWFFTVHVETIAKVGELGERLDVKDGAIWWNALLEYLPIIEDQLGLTPAYEGDSAAR